MNSSFSVSFDSSVYQDSYTYASSSADGLVGEQGLKENALHPSVSIERYNAVDDNDDPKGKKEEKQVSTQSTASLERTVSTVSASKLNFLAWALNPDLAIEKMCCLVDSKKIHEAPEKKDESQIKDPSLRRTAFGKTAPVFMVVYSDNSGEEVKYAMKFTEYKEFLAQRVYYAFWKHCPVMQENNMKICRTTAIANLFQEGSTYHVDQSEEFRSSKLDVDLVFRGKKAVEGILPSVQLINWNKYSLPVVMLSERVEGATLREYIMDSRYENFSFEDKKRLGVQLGISVALDLLLENEDRIIHSQEANLGNVMLTEKEGRLDCWLIDNGDVPPGFGEKLVEKLLGNGSVINKGDYLMIRANASFCMTKKNALARLELLRKDVEKFQIELAEMSSSLESLNKIDKVKRLTDDIKNLEESIKFENSLVNFVEFFLGDGRASVREGIVMMLDFFKDQMDSSPSALKQELEMISSSRLIEPVKPEVAASGKWRSKRRGHE